MLSVDCFREKKYADISKIDFVNYKKNFQMIQKECLFQKINCALKAADQKKLISFTIVQKGVN